MTTWRRKVRRHIVTYQIFPSSISTIAQTPTISMLHQIKRNYSLYDMGGKKKYIQIQISENIIFSNIYSLYIPNINSPIASVWISMKPLPFLDKHRWKERCLRFIYIRPSFYLMLKNRKPFVTVFCLYSSFHKM